MDPERRIVKTRPEQHSVDNEAIKRDLDRAISEYDKVKRIVDYFMLGLLMVVILYTTY